MPRPLLFGKNLLKLKLKSRSQKTLRFSQNIFLRLNKIILTEQNHIDVKSFNLKLKKFDNVEVQEHHFARKNISHVNGV